MAIIQISRIIQRSGNLVDLPQLAEAELGWANDEGLLFIGRVGSEVPENVEVLTSYSTISFNQIEGSSGDLNITTPVNGQLLAYDSLNKSWINTGGNSVQPGNTAAYKNFPIHLGNIDNVKIGGGSIGFVLQTDGQGNLSWTSKGTLRNEILQMYPEDPLIFTIANTTPYVNGLEISITGVNAANSGNIFNLNNYYVKLEDDFPVTGNVALYSDSDLVIGVDGSTLGEYIPNSGIATALLASAAGGTGKPGGLQGDIQFKGANENEFIGSSNLNWSGTTLFVAGTANVQAVIASNTVQGNQLRSTATQGTVPLIIASSTRIPNANVQTAGNLINGNSNIIVNGNISFGVSGSPNVVLMTSNGINVQGNANFSNIFTGLISSSGNAVSNNIIANNLSISQTGNINNLTATTISVTGNTILSNLSTGNITSLNVTATGNVTANYFIGNGSALTDIDTFEISNGNSNIRVFANSDVTFSIGGVSNVLKIEQANTRIYSTYDLSIDGNISALQFNGANANLNIITSNNITSNTSNSSTLNVSANANIGGGLSVTGNINTGNLQTNNLLVLQSFQGNVLTVNQINSNALTVRSSANSPQGGIIVSNETGTSNIAFILNNGNTAAAIGANVPALQLFANNSLAASFIMVGNAKIATLEGSLTTLGNIQAPLFIGNISSGDPTQSTFVKNNLVVEGSSRAFGQPAVEATLISANLVAGNYITNTNIYRGGAFYNDITGTFTVPANGIYCLSASAIFRNTSATALSGVLTFEISGNLAGRPAPQVSSNPIATGTQVTVNLSAPIVLTTGETVRVRCTTLSNTFFILASTSTYFSAALIA
jgi:hypothetical protein